MAWGHRTAQVYLNNQSNTRTQQQSENKQLQHLFLYRESYICINQTTNKDHNVAAEDVLCMSGPIWIFGGVFLLFWKISGQTFQIVSICFQHHQEVSLTIKEQVLLCTDNNTGGKSITEKVKERDLFLYSSLNRSVCMQPSCFLRNGKPNMSWFNSFYTKRKWLHFIYHTVTATDECGLMMANTQTIQDDSCMISLTFPRFLCILSN